VTGALWTRQDVLRYGENPHQRAALYVRAGERTGGTGIAGAEQLHGKAMSYNNYVDADAARRAAFDFAGPCAAIMKHANPCGIAIGADLVEAHKLANACDPTSAFGGVIAVNGTVTVALAEQVAPIFTEVIIAPDFEPAALDILARRKTLRVLRCPPPEQGQTIESRPVSGGLLMQSSDRVSEPGDAASGWRLATGEPASEETLADLEFAWKACRSVKSNAILLASGLASVGIGMGQVNRVDAAKLAVARAGDRAAGSVAASDAYFPFPDGLEVLTGAGIRAIVEPGGSMRDQLVIDAAQAAGVTLYFSGVRHFYH
jgi:phosphoribosylaminoimidazolecarboxamide formyltransferase / IMP cyclohydrolase